MSQPKQRGISKSKILFYPKDIPCAEYEYVLPKNGDLIPHRKGPQGSIVKARVK